MNIHLSKPGGQREGPFSVEQINHDLAAKKYQETDYWAWYEGLSEWVPLHSVPGVIVGASADAARNADYSQSGTQILFRPPEDNAPGADASSTPEPPALKKQLASGLPFSALEHILILTTGEGAPASDSAVTACILETIAGEPLDKIRENVPRDVLQKCAFLEQLRSGGPLPDTAWRAAGAIQPALVKQARDGAYRVCVRSFPVETGDVVALLLFYNKQKL